MIRSALIAFGLSAGAFGVLLFGVGPARAQGVVSIAPVVEVCSATRDEQVAPCATPASDVPSSGADVAEASVSAQANVASVPVPIISDDLADGFDAEYSVLPTTCMPSSVAAFRPDAVFVSTLSGSDPSADFCP